MEEKARKWSKNHSGYVAHITDYSFEFVEQTWDRKQKDFVEVKRYTVMASYMI